MKVRSRPTPQDNSDRSPYPPTVAYDDDLAARIRELLAPYVGVSEQKMFGGLGFLIGGNMAVAASGQGGILVRADPAESDKLVQTTAAEMAVMRGRPMAGWLRVAAADVATKRQLEKWVKIGVGYAGSLPAKAGAEPRATAATGRAGKTK